MRGARWSLPLWCSTSAFARPEESTSKVIWASTLGEEEVARAIGQQRLEVLPGELHVEAPSLARHRPHGLGAS